MEAPFENKPQWESGLVSLWLQVQVVWRADLEKAWSVGRGKMQKHNN